MGNLHTIITIYKTWSDIDYQTKFIHRDRKKKYKNARRQLIEKHYTFLKFVLKKQREEKKHSTLKNTVNQVGYD